MQFLGEIILVGFGFAPQGWALCNGQLLSIAQYDALFVLIGTTYGGDGQETFAVPDLRSRVPIHMGTGTGLPNYLIGEFGGVESVTLLVTQLPAHTHPIDVSKMTAHTRCRNAAATTTSPVGAVPAVEAIGTFTDATLGPGTTVKGAHLTELRSRVNSARAAHGLGAFSYTDPLVTPAATIIKSQHIVDLRTALNAVYNALSAPLPVYTDPALSAGVPVKAAHINELRAAAIAVAPQGTALTYSSSPADANMHGSAIAVAGSPLAVNTGGTQPHSNMQPFLTLNYCIALEGIFPSQS